MKKNIPILFFCFIIALTLAACAKLNTNPIYLPELDEIESVQITNNNEIIKTDNADWISELIIHAKLAEFTSKQSVQDIPTVSEYIQIDFTTKSSITTLYVYQENGKWYIEQPYQGIYLTDDIFLQMLTEAPIAATPVSVAPSPELTPTPETEASNTPEEAIKLIPSDEAIKPIQSEVAEELGISAENYPRIDGSTSTLPLLQGIYRYMFNPNDMYEFPGIPTEASKTMASYEMLIAGDVDLILVPDPSQDILDKVNQAKIELEYIPIGAEALVFITHKDNPAQNITKEQVVDIYTDMTINNWAQIGGTDGRIVPLCRNADAGSQVQMDNEILEGKPMAPEVEENFMEYDMNGMVQMVEDYRYFANDGEKNAYTLGYTMYYFLNLIESVQGEVFAKPLVYNGVEPTPETILSKEYPLATNYYAVMRKDTPANHSARIIADWLISYDGQWMVAVSGLGALKPVYEPTP